MCVLYACETKLPSLETLKANAVVNDDGMGVAWRDKGLVRWRKGFTSPSAVYAFASQLAFPILIHQRLTSAGETRPELCHPFPVTKGAGVGLGGAAKAVLAHNGTVFGWKAHLERAQKALGDKMPDGPWSDTRLMAWALAVLGDKALHQLAGGQKVAILTTQKLRIVNDHLWYKTAKDTGGYWQSADYSAWGAHRESAFWDRDQRSLWAVAP